MSLLIGLPLSTIATIPSEVWAISLIVPVKVLLLEVVKRHLSPGYRQFPDLSIIKAPKGLKVEVAIKVSK
jgi:hypothetical protein